jgi:adenylyl-sulfate kinase
MNSDMSPKGVKAGEVVWHGAENQITETSQLLGHRPITVWLTGLSGSGKSTLAFATRRELLERGKLCYVLDGDNVRHGLNRDLGFTREGRTENIRRVAEVARLMNDAGLIVVTALISPYIDDRRMAQETIGAAKFMEVYLSAPLEICEARDPKGMYKRARAGETAGFTGIDAPYEPPVAAELTLDTSIDAPAECARKLLAQLTPRIATGKGSASR